jgi:hypothetical protein
MPENLSKNESTVSILKGRSLREYGKSSVFEDYGLFSGCQALQHRQSHVRISFKMR